MALSFRTARKLWMGVVALLSLASISLAIVLWAHGYSKFHNFGALIIIPGFAFIGAVWTILKKAFLSPQIVSIEAVWVFTLLPFQIRKSAATWCDAQLISWPAVLGLFALESHGPGRSRFTPVYETLVAVVWINTALVFFYTTGIISLALLTQFSFDRGVWARDIDSSPCPFPFPVLLVYAFPFTASYFHRTSAESQEGPATATNHCLPGCPCHVKLIEVHVLDTLDLGRTNLTGHTQLSIPIRVPTMMERHDAIRVTLGNLAP